jgi:hypothetical protein
VLQHWQLWHCGARAAPWCVRIVPHCCAFVFSVHERRHSS